MATERTYQDDVYGVLDDVTAQLMVDTGHRTEHASDLSLELVRACRSGRVTVSGKEEHRDFMRALEAAESFPGGEVH